MAPVTTPLLQKRQTSELTFTSGTGADVRALRALHVDSEILEACQTGDVEAFRQLFEAYKSRVYSIALHFSADADVAHDITQQVFVTLYRALRTFRREAQFDTWLYRIVVNACLHEHRRKRRFVPLDIVSERLPSRTSSVEHDYIREQESVVVRHAIATLKPKLRIPLILKHLRGLSYEEIGAILGCSTGTVASRLSRARSSLAAKVAHLRPSGGSC